MNPITETLLNSGIFGDQRIMRRLIETGAVSEQQILTIAEETGVFSIVQHANDLLKIAINDMQQVNVSCRDDADTVLQIVKTWHKIKDQLPDNNTIENIEPVFVN